MSDPGETLWDTWYGKVFGIACFAFIGVMGVIGFVMLRRAGATFP
jgi:hypothetical protein